jgi:hypothetical protein
MPVSMGRVILCGVGATALAVAAGLTGATGATGALASISAPPVPSYVQTSGTSTVTPMLSGVVQDSAGAALDGQFFLLNSSGQPIGGSPTAVGTVPNGQRVIYRVPDGVLSIGGTYEWYMEACNAGTATCSSPTSTATFTINASNAPAASAAATTTTISGTGISDTDAITDAGACSAADCPLTSSAALNVGGDGTNHWAADLKFDLSAIPANAVITSAALHLTESACLNCPRAGQGRRDAAPSGLKPGACPALGCAPVWTGILDIYPADSLASTGPQLTAAADASVIASGPGNQGSYDLSAALQGWVNGGMPNDGLVLEAAGNAAATSGASYYSTQASAAQAPALVVTYAAPIVPAAPTGLSVVPGDGGAKVSWTAPADQGDAQGVTGYAVKALSTSGAVAASTSTQGNWTVLTGLANGSQYTISVAATNAEGTGTAAVNSAFAPAAVTGSAADAQAAQQFLDAQTALQEGQYPTAAAAEGSDSQAGMISGQLGAEQATDVAIGSGLQAQAVAETNGTNTLSGILAIANTGGTVSLYARDDLTYTTVTGVGTVSPDSTASESANDYLLTFSAGSSPQITGYVDAGAANSQVTGATNPSAFSTSLNDNPDTALPVGAQEPSATVLQPGSEVLPARTANLSGVSSWAYNHALAPFNGNDGYNSDDCTDFASRALQIGGGNTMVAIGYPFQNHADNHNWYFYGNPYNASFSWGGAYNLADNLYLIRSYFVKYWNNAKPGDIIFAAWSASTFSKIGHTGVITKMSNGMPLISQHTNDRRNEPLSVWLASHKNTHIWIAVPNHE